MSETLTEVAPTRSGHDEDVIHTVCNCNEDVAYCGEDVSDEPIIDDDVDVPWPCVVCEDLVSLPCARCGCPPDEPRCSACRAADA